MSRLGALSVAFSGLVGAIAIAVLAAPASGLDPPPPAKAQLVYSNGGRLIQMAADGTGRKVLTFKGAMIPGGIVSELGDSHPQVSPDGSQLLFTRYLDDGGNSPEKFFMVSGRDGVGPRAILRGGKDVEYGDPAWMPDGSIVATRDVRKRRKIERAIVVASATGGDARTILALRPHLMGSMKRDLSSNFDPIELSPSPDGLKLLIGMSDGYKDDHRWLELADLSTGQRRNIAPGGFSGAWSPDGSKIVYASNRGKKREICEMDGCTRPGDLFVGESDGSGAVRLTHGYGAEDSPSWSPDGSRIVFSSNRNVPRLPAAAEIYSIAPDGSCQTWLTNGTPASVQPSWDTVPGDANAGACGATDRVALAETKPLPWTTLPKKPRLWAGTDIGGRLVTSDIEFLGIEILDYRDCAFYRVGDCAPAAAVLSISSCLMAGSTAEIFGDLGRNSVPRTRRGVLTMTVRPSAKPSPVWPMVAFSGGGINYAIAYPGEKGARANGMKLFRSLRPMESEAVPKRLPAFRVAVRDLRQMKRVRATVRRTGSVRLTAKRLGIERKSVGDNLDMAKMLNRYGRYVPVRCPNLNTVLGFSSDGGESAGLPAEVRERFAESGLPLPRIAR